MNILWKFIGKEKYSENIYVKGNVIFQTNYKENIGQIRPHCYEWETI